MKKFYLICCEILRHEIEHLLGDVNSAVEVCFLRKGYHQNPLTLKEEVQKAIDAAGDDFDAILLGYGLCGKGLEDILARKVPLVIPRAHDCISLLLGSAAAYDAHFASHSGTYYYSPGWAEWGQDAVERSPAQGFGLDGSFEEYVARYGEENARYLMELEASWAKRYTRACYINTGIPDVKNWETQTKEIAAAQGWQFECLPGNLRFLRLLLEGPWSEEEFLIVPPGAQILATSDAAIMCAACPRNLYLLALIAKAN